MEDAYAVHTSVERERRDNRSREELIGRLRREFDGLAGLTLTVRQAMRLFNLEQGRCERLLDDLVRRGELTQVGHGAYKRPGKWEP